MDQRAYDDLRERGSGLRGPEALKFLWEDFLIPYAVDTASPLLDLVRRFAPDVMVVDQQAVAGAVVARQLGIPWATSATTSAELTDPLADLPKVDAWVRAKLVDLQVGLGLDPQAAATGDLRFSNHLVIAFTTEALLGHVALPSSPIRFVGPSISKRADPTPFPWEELDSARRHVLVTLGTLNAEVGRRFFSTAIDALADMPVKAVFVMPPDLLDAPSPASNIIVRPRIPQLAVLERMDAVVTHGGHNTVCESLAQGLPLVLAPIRDDQPIVADQVVRAGAGIRVRFGRVTAAELRDAVQRVLDEPGYRSAAAVIQQSFNEAGGEDAAADAIDDLLVATPSGVPASVGPRANLDNDC
jgi:MGT family glycosyltransferase